MGDSVVTAGGGLVDDPRIAAALRRQDELRSQVDLTSGLSATPELVAGLDVSYEVGTQRVVAAAVVMGLRSLAVREVSLVHSEVDFPYVPGLLAFREAPFLLEALEKLATRPEVLICDGYADFLSRQAIREGSA